MALPHVSDGFLTDVGDLFSWLESGVESVVSIIEDAANEVWHFVVSIGDKIYYGILDAVEKVVAAAIWIYKAIKVAIDDVIKFLEFLFAWPDILVTHRVMKNLFTHLVQTTIDGLTDVKADLASLFKQLQADVNKWADIPNFDQTPAGTLTSDPNEVNTGNSRVGAQPVAERTAVFPSPVSTRTMSLR